MCSIMKRIIIFGNSGSGKSTLARKLAKKHLIKHLDLDVLAWEDTSPPMRKSIHDSGDEIDQFIQNNQSWVIEGCYTDLLSIAAKHANEMVFINPGVETCIQNCRDREWEPHKYLSKHAQDNNLDMLINWVKQYPLRGDEFSLIAHQNLYNGFAGKKIEILSQSR